MAIRQIGNNTLVGLQTELPVTGSSGSFFMAENTSNLYGYYSAGTPTLISGATRSLQQVIDVNQTADKVQFIYPNIVAKADSYLTDAILLQNNNFMIYGGFLSYNGSLRNRICELDLTGSTTATSISFSGSIDNGTVFVSNNVVETIDGIYVIGSFTQVNGTPSNRIVRFRQDGSIDNTFIIGTGFNNPTHGITKYSNNKILVSGNYNQYKGVTVNSSLIRLNPDGSRDSTLNLTGTTNNLTFSTTIDSLNRIYVSYYGTIFNGRTQNGIMRLFDDGSIDGSFNVGSGINSPNQKLHKIAIDSIGRIYLYGDVLIYNGVTINRIARLN